MPWSGNGTFSRVYSWVTDQANSVLVRADRMDTDSNDIASGISNCIARDGQAPPTADIPWGSKKITSLANGVLPADAVNFAQVFTSPTFTTPSAAATPASSDNSTLLATTAYVVQKAFATALPAQTGISFLTTSGGVASWTGDQTGNSGKFLTTNGAVLSWALIPSVAQNLFLNTNYGGY